MAENDDLALAADDLFAANLGKKKKRKKKKVGEHLAVKKSVAQ